MGNLNPKIVRLHSRDDVCVAIDIVAKGTDWEGVVSSDSIPAGHKMSVNRIASGEPVRKFNQIIGFASCDIEPGQHVHTHNLSLIHI